MPRIVHLDSGPLSLACHHRPDRNRTVADFQGWLDQALKQRIRIIVPATADYEVRRELIRIGSDDSIANLDLLQGGEHPVFPGVLYLPLADAALKRAAGLWAQARQQGHATAGDHALDGDVLIVAQVLEDMGTATRFTIATGNVGDIARYVGARRAQLWTNIVP